MTLTEAAERNSEQVAACRKYGVREVRAITSCQVMLSTEEFARVFAGEVVKKHESHSSTELKFTSGDVAFTATTYHGGVLGNTETITLPEREAV